MGITQTLAGNNIWALVLMEFLCWLFHAENAYEWWFVVTFGEEEISCDKSLRQAESMSDEWQRDMIYDVNVMYKYEYE